MKKNIFLIITTLGLLTIIILSIIIPNNPNQIIPSLTHFFISKPLWINVLISCTFIYINIIYKIYNTIFNRI